MAEKNREASGKFAKGTRTGEGTRFAPGQNGRVKKDHWDKEWLEVRYVKAWRTVVDIAREAGCSESNIWHWLRRHGIERAAR
jgi:hypothetical protein